LNHPEALLTKHFSQELEISKELLHLLKQEEDALSRQEIRQISELTVTKNNLLLKFMNLRTLRIQNLSSIGLPREESLIPEWIKLQKNPKLHQIWADLTAELIQCKEINTLNGMMIQKLSSMNRSALQLLVGQDPTKDIYGPGSSAVNTSKFNILG
jgi:flagella synthesis protein FlgN